MLGSGVGTRADVSTAAAGPLDTAADLAAALHFEQRLLDHLHYGQIHEQHYRTPARAAGDIETLVGEEDSALYTGNYLAGEAFRYALARKKLTHAAGDAAAVAFWTAQRDDALTRVTQMVDKFHLLVNIAESWQTTFHPHLNGTDPTADGFIDFGGGLIPGEAGLLFRACNPVDAPAPLNVGRDTSRGRLVGPLTWRDGTKHWCLDSTSRDAYAGTTFGLATALDLVAVDHPAMRKTIARDLMTMSSYALKYIWTNPRPHGRVVIPEVFGGNDLDNFISPLFIYTAMAQMNMAQVARHAANVAGTAADRAKWDLVWLTQLATMLPQLSGSMLVDAATPHDSYYKFHLNHITGFNLVRLEPNNVVRGVMRHAFSVMDATTGDDLDALYEAITFSLTGEQSRLQDAVLHNRQWLDYRANLDANANRVDHRARCGHDLACVPLGQLDIIQPLPGRAPLVVTKSGTGEPARRQASPRRPAPAR